MADGVPAARSAKGKAPAAGRSGPGRRRATGEPSAKRVQRDADAVKEMANKVLTDMTYVGTEFDYQSKIDEHAWCWDTLIDDLREGGKLYAYANTKDDGSKRKYVYMFATSEVQQIFTKKHPEGVIVPIPVVVSIVSDVGLGPCRLGIKGVQMDGETIIEGKKLRYEFVKTPLVPVKPKATKTVKQSVPTVYVLGSSERISSGKNTSIDRQKTFEFANPYFFIPKLVKSTIEETVSSMCDFEVKFPGSRRHHKSMYSTDDTFPEFSHIVADEEMKVIIVPEDQKSLYLNKLNKLKKGTTTSRRGRRRHAQDEKVSESVAEKEEQEDEKETSNEVKAKEANEDNSEGQGKEVAKLEKEGDGDPLDEIKISVDQYPVTQEEYDKLLTDIQTTAQEAYKKYSKTFAEYRKELKDRLDKMPEETKNALDNLTIIKYYPHHPNFEMSGFTSSFAGRYIGNATSVVVCEKRKDDSAGNGDDDEEESEL